VRWAVVAWRRRVARCVGHIARIVKWLVIRSVDCELETSHVKLPVCERCLPYRDRVENIED
jgi:hypothetical protein